MSPQHATVRYAVIAQLYRDPLAIAITPRDTIAGVVVRGE
jgi:hypothetical protein